MRLVLAGLSNVSFYFYNIFVYSTDWNQHCSALRSVFDRIRMHHLTLKSSKCHFGFPTIQYLGFILGGDCLQPLPDKVEALCRILPPKIKKLLRSCLTPNCVVHWWVFGLLVNTTALFSFIVSYKNIA